MEQPMLALQGGKWCTEPHTSMEKRHNIFKIFFVISCDALIATLLLMYSGDWEQWLIFSLYTFMLLMSQGHKNAVLLTAFL
jgi:hypothetical protein